MIITRTPLRISFLGGGTDFADFYLKYGGCVLTTAIDKYTYCIVKERFDNLIYVSYSEKEIVEKVSDIRHNLVREALKIVGITKGIEITLLSDIPSGGTGLGSSSSFAVGILNALYAYTGQYKDTQQLAQEACRLEIEILKEPIGIQDQYIAAYGGLRFIEFSSQGVVVNTVKLPAYTIDDISHYLMTFFTGMTRSSKTVLTEQKQNIPQTSKILQQMAKQAHKGKLLLEQGKIKELGRLLHQGWQLKKKLASNISNPTIDNMYTNALNSGAIGGKISGAGNGGFLTLFVPSSKHPKVRHALKTFTQMPIKIDAEGTKIIFNGR